MRRLTRSQIIRHATTYTTITRTPDEAAALLAGCVPCELAQAQSETLDLTTRESTFDVNAGGMVPWEGTLTIEGRMTGDGRWIDPGALRWENLPLPLRYAPEDEGGHSGAVVVGTIDTAERLDDGRIWGTGFIDLSTDDGRECARGLDTRQMRGVSVDMDDVSFEIRVAADLLEREEELEEADEANEVPPGAVDAEGRITVIAIESDDEVFATTAGRIRAATVVAIPAFIDAELTLSAPTALAAGAQPPLMLVAGAAPVDPPSSWFQNPHLPGPTRLTITDDGRVFGHLAEWGTCHRSHTQQGRCITPPYTATKYSHFHTGTIKTAEGDLIAVGALTMGTGHAALSKGMTEAAVKAHYENSGTVAADVVMGEDAYGIWYAGAIRPNLSATQVREFRALSLSGDWRPVGGGGFELVAALAVPTPGFPIMPAGLVAGGEMMGLVAAGVLSPDTPRGVLSDDDVDLLRELATAERERRAEGAQSVTINFNGPPAEDVVAALAARVKASALAARVRVTA